jgi:hypothetical protein
MLSVRDVERDTIERALRVVAEQAAKAGELFDEATAAGGGSHPVTVHAKSCGSSC